MLCLHCVSESEVSGEIGSGHRGSLRGANKLARRARSFKDDLLERISNMRSPAQSHHPPHLVSAIRYCYKYYSNYNKKTETYGLENCCYLRILSTEKN